MDTKQVENVKIVIITLILLPLIFIFSFTTLHFLEKFFDINYQNREILDSNRFNKPPGIPVNNFLKYNSLLPRVNRQGQIEGLIKNNDKLEAKVMMSVNKFLGRRTIRQVKNPKSIIIFAGDSQTFGYGVKDNEVFSNLLASKYVESQIINMGLLGWSPVMTNLLFDPQYSDIKSSLPSIETKLVYLYYPYMSDRDTGLGNEIFTQNGYGSYAQFEKEQLVYLGRFKDVYSFAPTRLMSFLGLHDFWNKIKKETFKIKSYQEKNKLIFSAKVLKTLERNLKKLNQKNQLIILLCALDKTDINIPKIFSSYELVFYNLRDKKVCQRTNEFHFSDSHLNSAGHEHMAQEVHKIINQ